MTTTSVADIMECGGRVTIEQVVIFVDAPLVILLVLSVVFTTLTSMKSKKTTSVPGVCAMFLKMSPPAILCNRHRLRDHVIFVRVTDTNDKSCNWVEFNPLCGTTYIDLPLPTRQRRLSMIEIRITCPDTYHRPSPQYAEWSRSATSHLRCLKPLSIQSSHLDYQMDTKPGAISTTPLEDVKVVYHLTPRPIKSSAQDIIQRGCLVWLSLCLAGLLSFGITQYINLAYSESATAIVMNVMDILITTSNITVAIIPGVLAFLFVKILATPFRRYNRRQRRLNGHILGHDLSDMKTSPSIQSLESDVSIQEAKLLASGAFDATQKIVDPQSILLSPDIPTAPDDQTQEVELFDNKVNLVQPFESKSLTCLDCLTLKSANPSPSDHSLPASASSMALQYCPASFSISCEKDENSPLTNKPSMVTEESSLTNKPSNVQEERSPLANKPEKVTEESLTLTNRYSKVIEENTEEPSGISLPRSSESSTSVSSTFTIESLPEELPRGVYRTEKYVYTECSTPWYYNPWLHDRPFNYSVYFDSLNNKNHNSYNNINKNNNNNSNVITVCIDIEEGIEKAEVSPSTIKITKSYAPFLLVMFAMLGSVIAFHIYVVKASLCQQFLAASAISWIIASLLLMLIWFAKQMYDLCQSFLNN